MKDIGVLFLSVYTGDVNKSHYDVPVDVAVEGWGNVTEKANPTGLRSSLSVFPTSLGRVEPDLVGRSFDYP